MKEERNVVIKQGCHSKLDLESHRMLLRNDEILNSIIYETPYKNTTGCAPAVKAAVWDDEGRTATGNVGQVLPDDIVTYRSGVNPTISCKGHPTECWVSTQPIKRATSKGFTLIELLVVVLIIGILAAIALPQYQKAVEKSKAIEGITLLKSIYNAAEYYYMSQGQWPRTFEQLEFQLPLTGKQKGNTLANATDALSNEDWSLQLYNDNNSHILGVQASRLRGRYKGTGFVFYFEYANLPTRSMICFERVSNGVVFDGKAGSYCNSLFGGTLKRGVGTTLRYYILP